MIVRKKEGEMDVGQTTSSDTNDKGYALKVELTGLANKLHTKKTQEQFLQCWIQQLGRRQGIY